MRAIAAPSVEVHPPSSTQWRDAIDWQSTGSAATWHKEVPFDNVELRLETAPKSMPPCAGNEAMARGLSRRLM